MLQKHDAINLQGHNEINGDFGQIANEQTLCRSYKLLQNVGNTGLKQRIFLSFFRSGHQGP